VTCLAYISAETNTNAESSASCFYTQETDFAALRTFTSLSFLFFPSKIFHFLWRFKVLKTESSGDSEGILSFTKTILSDMSFKLLKNDFFCVILSLFPFSYNWWPQLIEKEWKVGAAKKVNFCMHYDVSHRKMSRNSQILEWIRVLYRHFQFYQLNKNIDEREREREREKSGDDIPKILTSPLLESLTLIVVKTKSKKFKWFH
jgi:hypothetical protein